MSAIGGIADIGGYLAFEGLSANDPSRQSATTNYRIANGLFDYFVGDHEQRLSSRSRDGRNGALDFGRVGQASTAWLVGVRCDVSSRSRDCVGALRLTPAKGEILAGSFVQRDHQVVRRHAGRRGDAGIDVSQECKPRLL
jgi:hypothetical protein